MAASDVRVGFVGCGVHARSTLIPAVQRVGIDLAAICDLDKRLAQRTRRRFGAFRSYQDLRRMVEEMDIDALLVCGPPELHAEAGPVALEAGCHLWVEVPTAPNADEAQWLAEMARDRGLVAGAGLNARFAPVYVRARAIMQEPEFGELRSMEVVWWRPETHGHDDPLLFDLPHALDLVRYLGGDVSELSVQRGRDDRALAVALELDSGAVATVSFAAPVECPRECVQIASDRATATVTGRREVSLRTGDRAERRVWEADVICPEDADAPWDPRGYPTQMQHFADAIGGDAEPQATLADAAAAMRLAETVTGRRREGGAG
jgi:myo-inositol 2-dehydrogenase/D-chiro-inositol 1-dehydrogenase